jgi:hypothetical protein
MKSGGGLIVRWILLPLVAFASTNNSRPFSIMLAGLGPANGQDVSSPDTQWALSLPWAQDYLAVSCNWDASAESVKETIDLGWSVVLTAWASSFFRSHKASDDGDVANLTTAVNAMLEAGLPEEEIIWEYICEDDSAGTGFPQQIMRLARDAGYTNGATKLTAEEAMEAWLSYATEAYENTLDWPSVARHARPGFPSSAHSLAPFADVLLIERTNDDVGSLAPSLAFLRGAARQFSSGSGGDDDNQKKMKKKKEWGVDLSLWWGVINGCVEDLPASTHRRAMLVAYVAGASTVSVEGCGWVDADSGDPYPMSDVVASFGNFVAGVLPPEERGVPDTPVAVVLSATHGWSERPSWGGAGQGSSLWGFGNLPARAKRGSGAVDGLLAAAYPGAGGAFGYGAFPFGKFEDNLNPPASPWARSAMTDGYAPDPDDVWYAESPLPFGEFHDRNALKEWFRGVSGGRDPAPWRPLADTRWGDVIDILVNTAAADDDGDDDEVATEGKRRRGGLSFSGYEVVVWCDGDGPLSDAAAEALAAFASEEGGTVVLAAGAAGLPNSAAHASLTGIANLTGRLRSLRAWEWAPEREATTGAATATVDAFAIAEVNLAAAADDDDDAVASVVARSVPEGLPVILERRLGAGVVYTVLAPWFEAGGAAGGLSSAALALFDDVIGAAQPVAAEPSFGLLHSSSLRVDDAAHSSARVVALSNNAGAAWKGLVRVDHGAPFPCATLRCEDLTIAAASTPIECTAHNSSAEAAGAWAGEAHGEAGAGQRRRRRQRQQSVRVPLSIEAHDAAVIRVTCFLNSE